MKAAIAVPATLMLCYRAYSHKSLTPAGIVTAALTAIAHAIHLWNLPFVLLVVFFLAGTRVTKTKHEIKKNLTIQSTGTSGGEGPRTHVQVLANSGVASVLILLHAYQLSKRSNTTTDGHCYPWGGDLLVVGIIANYAAVAADTFSSELGILSKSKPRLITSWNLRQVPPGTNGGVTLWGLVAGLMGSMVVTTAALLTIPFCGTSMGRNGGEAGAAGGSGGAGWEVWQRQYFAFGMVLWGGLGSVLDSVLGGLLQQSVVDTRSGRVVEGDGGKRVLISESGPSSMHLKKRAEVKAQLLNHEGKDAIPKPIAGDVLDDESAVEDELDEKMGGGTGKYDASKKMRQASFGDGRPTRVAESGFNVLDNNEVNFLMALTMSLGAMAIAGWVWDVPLSSIWTF